MRHLLSAADLSLAEVTSILDTADEMHTIQQRQIKKLPTLRGRTVINMFFEDSTRTRTSFELAGKWMSADTINISAKGSSTSKGERCATPCSPWTRWAPTASSFGTAARGRWRKQPVGCGRTW